LAGGADAKAVVVLNRIPPGTDPADARASAARGWGAPRVTIWHAEDLKTAEAEPFLTALRAATGVWFTGGRPALYADPYVGSAAQREFRAVLDRGGVIGGESAGAVIQSTHCVLPPEPRTERGPFAGFGLVRNVTVFPHLAGEKGKFPLQFCRQFVAANPGLLGLGIDDGAAVILRGHDAEVVGSGMVTVIAPAAGGESSVTTYQGGDRFKLPPESLLDALCRDAGVADAPGVAVLVVHNGRVMFRKAYGFADLELRVPLRPEHVFRIASITKQFTAVAILQLAGAGKLSLDDDITRHLPDYPTHGRRIPLTHLLTHTSGVPSYTDVLGFSETLRQDRTVAQLFAVARDRPPEFEPGRDWRYSNTNYALLGAVIEKVSGRAYGDYLRAHLLVPACLESTTYDSAVRLIPDRVRGYSRAAGGWANAEYVSTTLPYAAGGLLSNIDDLWKWEQALTSGKLIAPERHALARSEHKLADGRGTGYGFGCLVGTLDGHATVEHGGRAHGFTGYALGAADAGLFVAVLCNTDDKSAARPERLATRIARSLLDDRTTTVGPAPERVLQEYVGGYRGPEGELLRFAAEQGELTVEDRGGRRPLVRTGNDAFLCRRDVTRFRFVRDDKHRVQYVLVHPRLGVERRLSRQSDGPEDRRGP
jgi:CubicO group peptidase (beta-lactamase class C family)